MHAAHGTVSMYILRAEARAPNEMNACRGVEGKRGRKGRGETFRNVHIILTHASGFSMI